MKGLEQKEILNLFNAVKLDDLTSFCTLLEKNADILKISFGRFPLLSVCYLYDSKKIVKRFKKDLIGIDEFIVIDEPFVIYKDFRLRCGKAIRLFANSNYKIMPIEMMAILQKDAFVKRNYKSFAKDEFTTEKLIKIYQLNNQKCQINDKNIKISAKKLSKKAKKTILMSSIFSFSAMAICFTIIAIIASTIGLGTSFSPRKVFSENDFLKLANRSNICAVINDDITLKNKFDCKNFNGTILGNGKTITIDYEYNSCLFDSFNGKIENANFVFNTTTITATKDVSLFCNTNNGLVENLNFSFDGSVEFLSDNTSTYFCTVAVTNNNKIKNCNINFSVNATSNSGKDSYVCGICAINNSKIENCEVLSNSQIITNNVDAAGICVENAFEKSILNCKNNATITQNTNLENWSPAVAGIVLTNVGKVENCLNFGNLKIESSAETSNNAIIIIGGICASNNATIYHSKNCADITISSKNNTIYAGGICGYVNTSGEANNPIIDFCVAEGKFDISKQSDDVFAYCGGIAGFMIGNITNCCSLSTFKNGFDKEKNNIYATMIGSTLGQAIINPFTGVIISVTLYLNIQNDNYVINESIPQPVALIYANNNAIYIENSSELNFTAYQTEDDLKANEIYW